MLNVENNILMVKEIKKSHKTQSYFMQWNEVKWKNI